MRKVMGLFAALILVVSTTARAQSGDADIQKVGEQYQAAFNKGDAKALSQLFAENGMMIDGAARLVKGRAAIEKDAAFTLGGMFKGAKLTIHPGSSQSLAGDVVMTEGTFEIAGGQAPGKGRYMNTLVRQGGQWRLASVAIVPDNAGAAGGK